MPILTDALARSATPPAGKNETVIWDDRTTGFGLRVRSTGGKTWMWVRRDADDKVRRYTIGPASSIKAPVARAIAEQRNAERDAARHGVTIERTDRSVKRRAPVVEAPTGPTLRDFWPDWLAHLQRKERSPKTLEEYRRHIIGTTGAPGIGDMADMPAKLIKRSTVTALIVGIEEDVSARTAAAVRSTLSSMFTWLLTTDRLGDDMISPILHSYKPEQGESRDRVLKPEEVRAIWRACERMSGGYGAIIRLLALTGQRRQEIGGLRSHELMLDVAHPHIDLPGKRTKNKLPHMVPLASQSLQLIEPWTSVAGGEPLFGRGKEGFSGWSASYNRLVDLADEEFGRPMAHWTLHDLRRTFVTQTKDETHEENYEVIEVFVNHISGAARAGVAGVYNRARLIGPRRELAQRYANWITSIVS